MASSGLKLLHDVIQGDCIEVLKDFDDDTFDSVVTDPPYALSFMGKDWDSFGDGKGFQAWCEEWAAECLRVLKPGGYLLAFGGTRTYHRETCAIEDAGFEIRDSLHWIYGSGFPKSRDVSKAIDSEAGAEREVIGKRTDGRYAYDFSEKASRSGGVMGNDAIQESRGQITAPATEAAKARAGWGTALKPAHEPIVMARKPLSDKTVAANVLEFGTGAINIDGCRIPTDEDRSRPPRTPNALYGGGKGTNLTASESNREGRWPPNVLLSQEAAEEMDRQSGILKSGTGAIKKASAKDMGTPSVSIGRESRLSGTRMVVHADSLIGGASRFFPCFRYCAKAAKRERPVVDGIPAHPTVKPLALMRWLVKLVTPPAGYVLDPFAGTGTTAEACELEGFNSLLIERDPDSIRRIEKRMSKYGEGS